MAAEVEGQVAGAWSAAKQATVQERRKSMDDRRRSQGESVITNLAAAPECQCLG
jgi:hypothetical protein